MGFGRQSWVTRLRKCIRQVVKLYRYTPTVDKNVSKRKRREPSPLKYGLEKFASVALGPLKRKYFFIVQLMSEVL